MSFWSGKGGFTVAFGKTANARGLVLPRIQFGWFYGWPFFFAGEWNLVPDWRPKVRVRR